MNERQVDPVAHADADQRRFAVQRIYIKALSFRAHGSTEDFRAGNKPPEITLNLNTETRKLSADLYEVMLKISFNAAHKDSQALIYRAEVKQAGIFVIGDFPEQEFMYVLNTTCPGILFPYARHALSRAVEQGGFPKLMLAPMSFEVLHQHYLQQMQQTAAAPAEPRH
jgi:preprotein translocase subunit SecB